jgi:tripartite-type tricarboxylate transporter receptor subunit TctC
MVPIVRDDLNGLNVLNSARSSREQKMKRIFLFVLIYLGLGAEVVLSQAPFYKDKTISVVLGGPPGGSADMRTRAVTILLRKHIPGNPTLVIQYMSAGGGRQAANHVYKAAKPDGLTIGSMGAALVTNAVLGVTGVQYDIDKFIYLGTPDSAQHYIFITNRKSGLTSLEKLRAASGVRIGAQSVGHPVYTVGRIFAYFLGLKEPRFVTGYTGPEIDIALINGEIDARAGTGETIILRSPEWLEKGLVDIHAGIEIPKGQRHPHYAQLPEVETFAVSTREKRLLEMFRSFRLSGQSFFLPSETPKERVQILHEAMRKTLADPEFFKEFRKLTGDDPTPLMPEALAKAIREMPRDADVVELFKKLAGPDTLPPR